MSQSRTCFTTAFVPFHFPLSHCDTLPSSFSPMEYYGCASSASSNSFSSSPRTYPGALHPITYYTNAQCYTLRSTCTLPSTSVSTLRPTTSSMVGDDLSRGDGMGSYLRRTRSYSACCAPSATLTNMNSPCCCEASLPDGDCITLPSPTSCPASDFPRGMGMHNSTYPYGFLLEHFSP